MRLPYGISNFGELRRRQAVYIDKTGYIPLLEDLDTGGMYLVLMRPRRFGKSLLISTLAHYYDVGRAEQFTTLFADLEVGRAPTPERNRYLILSLELSGMARSRRDASVGEAILDNFRDRLNGAMTAFCRDYATLIPEATARWAQIDHSSDPATLMYQFLQNLSGEAYQLYLLVDEYDSFANDLIARGRDSEYTDLVHGTGFIRQFYQVVKEGTKEGIIGRIFMTGIAPITMDDLASSANIFQNLTLDARFNEALGFTTAQVSALLERVLSQAPHRFDRASILDDLRHYYNGYLFSPDAGERLYNPDMVLYFFQHLRPPDHYPRKLLDSNVRMDHGRMRSLLVAPDGALRALPNQVIRRLLTEGSYDGLLDDTFPLAHAYDDEYFVSHLFYLGLLTIGADLGLMTRFVVPNYVIEQLHLRTLSHLLSDLAEVTVDRAAVAAAVLRMAEHGDVQPFLALLQREVLQKLSNRDLIQAQEKDMKFILLAWLALTDVFYPFSEMELGGGYSDLVLTLNRHYKGARFSLLLELKYCKEGATPAQISDALAAADRQLRRYQADPRVQAVAGPAGYRAWAVLFVGTAAIHLRELGTEATLHIRTDGEAGDAG